MNVHEVIESPGGKLTLTRPARLARSESRRSHGSPSGLRPGCAREREGQVPRLVHGQGGKANRGRRAEVRDGLLSRHRVSAEQISELQREGRQLFPQEQGIWD